MDWEDHDARERFRQAWESVEIARSIAYSLFTFGESVLPYFLVCGRRGAPDPVSLARGEVRIHRPMLITPDTSRPEFRNFFEDQDEEEVASFLLARTAQFSNLRFDNQQGLRRNVEGDLDGAIAKLNRQLDSEEDDRVAILVAPPKLGGVAVLRYATERVMESAPGNIQELRERGFLP